MNCVFCQIINKTSPAHIVYEDDMCIAFLDHRPITRGHLQLTPKMHYRWVYDIPDMGKLFAVAQHIIRGIIPVLGADHITMGTFGNEVPHGHIWIVPQYQKDAHVSERSGKKITEQGVIELAKILRSALLKEVEI